MKKLLIAVLLLPVLALAQQVQPVGQGWYGQGSNFTARSFGKLRGTNAIQPEAIEPGSNTEILTTVNGTSKWAAATSSGSIVTQAVSSIVWTNGAGGLTGLLTISGTNSSASVSNSFFTTCSTVLLTLADTTTNFVGYSVVRGSGVFTVYLSAAPGTGNFTYVEWLVANYCNTNITIGGSVNTNVPPTVDYADMIVDVRGDAGVSLSGGKVTTLSNLASQVYYSGYTQTNDNFMLTVAPNDLNNKNTIYCDGTTNGLAIVTVSPLATLATNATWIARIKRVGSSESYIDMYSTAGSGDLRRINLVQTGTGQFGLTFGNPATYRSFSHTVSTNSYDHLAITWDGVNSTLYVNGVSNSTVASTSFIPNSIGTYDSSQASAGQFYIAELQIWKRILSAADIAALNAIPY